MAALSPLDGQPPTNSPRQNWRSNVGRQRSRRVKTVNKKNTILHRLPPHRIMFLLLFRGIFIPRREGAAQAYRTECLFVFVQWLVCVPFSSLLVMMLLVRVMTATGDHS